MKLTNDELEFLSAWAREEWEPACYQLPAHRLQLAHGVSGAQLIVFIKAWTEGEGKKDQDILGADVNPQPRWPWPTTEDFGGRFAEASQWLTRREGLNNGSGVQVVRT
jgi:hypothetical protein